MKLMFLGTGAGVPSKGRNVSSLILKLLDERNEMWMFDCGEATQHQILETTIKPRKITKIFITHLHGDHIFGLPGFLSSRGYQGGDQPLTVYGPRGIKTFIQTTFKVSQTHIQYPLDIVELDSNGGTIQLDRGWKVDYLPLEHGILSFGFRITEPDSVGELLVDKLADYNIPNGPIYGRIKRGEMVTLDDGRVLNGKEFVGEDKIGKIVTILGDTRTNLNSERLSQDADVLVHECTMEASEPKMARAYFHSTSKQAASVAKAANVKQLYLNHISARFLGKDAKRLEQEAQSIFSNSRLVYDLNEFDIMK